MVPPPDIRREYFVPSEDPLCTGLQDSGRPVTKATGKDGFRGFGEGSHEYAVGHRRGKQAHQMGDLRRSHSAIPLAHSHLQHALRSKAVSPPSTRASSASPTM